MNHNPDPQVLPLMIGQMEFRIVNQYYLHFIFNCHVYIDIYIYIYRERERDRDRDREKDIYICI